jgi:hypothetical protein
VDFGETRQEFEQSVTGVHYAAPVTMIGSAIDSDSTALGRAVTAAGATDRRSELVRRARRLRPGLAHAVTVISCVVAVKACAMSYAALHDLAIRNFVPPNLASNVPMAIDGLMVGSILATAFFRRRSAKWWYATGLFALSALVSVAGNIAYARAIGGGYVAVVIHAGMPLTTMFAAHLTLMLWSDDKQRSGGADSAVEAERGARLAESDLFMQSVERHLRSIDSLPNVAAAHSLAHAGGRD